MCRDVPRCAEMRPGQWIDPPEWLLPVQVEAVVQIAVGSLNCKIGPSPQVEAVASLLPPPRRGPAGSSLLHSLLLARVRVGAERHNPAPRDRKKKDTTPDPRSRQSHTTRRPTTPSQTAGGGVPQLEGRRCWLLRCLLLFVEVSIEVS